MKLMPALPESIFDIAYLLFAIISGALMLARAKKASSKLAFIFGAATLILGLGDSFHLVPRVLNYWTDLSLTAALGIGKLVTSVTMTAFYLILEYAREERYMLKNQKAVLVTMWVFAAFRIILCLFPQNGWTAQNPPLSWGIIRNIPFVIMGVLQIVLWFKSAREDKPLKLLWLLILLSFGFYLPVVLFAGTVPIIGMLMLPKTVMYILMIVSFKKAIKPKK